MKAIAFSLSVIIISVFLYLISDGEKLVLAFIFFILSIPAYWIIFFILGIYRIDLIALTVLVIFNIMILSNVIIIIYQQITSQPIQINLNSEQFLALKFVIDIWTNAVVFSLLFIWYVHSEMKLNKQIFRPILQNKELTRFKKIIKVITAWYNSADFK